MCYICSCFTWTLDLIQRILTFFLSCWLCCAVCSGLLIAIVAGIAYGYNYCLAEFVSHTGTDLSVYMRRGQFNDRPVISSKNRRSGDDDEEYLQETPSREDALSDQWISDQDTRKYAEKLTKYSDSRKNFDNAEQSNESYYHEDLSRKDYDLEKWVDGQLTNEWNDSIHETTIDDNLPFNVSEGGIFSKPLTPPTRRVSILPHPIIKINTLQHVPSNTVMRKLNQGTTIGMEPSVEEHKQISLNVTDQETDLNKVTPPEKIERKTKAFSPDYITSRLRVGDTNSYTRKVIPMRHWGITVRPTISEYSTKENNIIEIL